MAVSSFEVDWRHLCWLLISRRLKCHNEVEKKISSPCASGLISPYIHEILIKLSCAKKKFRPSRKLVWESVTCYHVTLHVKLLMVGGWGAFESFWNSSTMGNYVSHSPQYGDNFSCNNILGCWQQKLREKFTWNSRGYRIVN